MNQEKALQLVKPHLTEKRYTHTIGVMHAAVSLAKRYEADQKKAELAAIFHDYAKFRDKKEMQTLVQHSFVDKTILMYGDELLHAPCGAHYVKIEIGIDDEEILSAIRYHTTGRQNMTLLEKIIFLADYIEPNRQMKGVGEVRKISETNLDEAIVLMIENTVSFLMKRRQFIYPGTIAMYNELVRSFQNRLK